MSRRTTVFELGGNRTGEIRPVVLEVYARLKEKGYNPVAQIAGYILSEDPARITAHGNARTMMSNSTWMSCWRTWLSGICTMR